MAGFAQVLVEFGRRGVGLRVVWVILAWGKTSALAPVCARRSIE